MYEPVHIKVGLILENSSPNKPSGELYKYKNLALAILCANGEISYEGIRK